MTFPEGTTAKKSGIFMAGSLHKCPLRSLIAAEVAQSQSFGRTDAMLLSLVLIAVFLTTFSDGLGQSNVRTLADFGHARKGGPHRRDYPAGSCRDKSCCQDNLQSLNAECFVVIPFLTSLITYFIAYAYGLTNSATSAIVTIGSNGTTSTTIVRTVSVTCSTTVTTSVSSISVQFTTITGTVTVTQEATNVVNTMITTTVYTPLLSVTTFLTTSTLTTTPTSYFISTVTMPSYFIATRISCSRSINPGNGRRSIKIPSMINGVNEVARHREMRFAPRTEEELLELNNQTSHLEPSY